eukprot:s2782_g6.t2
MGRRRSPERRATGSVRSAVRSAVRSVAAVFDSGDAEEDDGYTWGAELNELRKQLQDALESRSTAIVQHLGGLGAGYVHYKDIAQPDVNEKVYDEITKISAALKQLKAGPRCGAASWQAVAPVAPGPGNAAAVPEESLAADLRRQLTLSALSTVASAAPAAPSAAPAAPTAKAAAKAKGRRNAKVNEAVGSWELQLGVP